MDATDAELLATFTGNRSEDAFRELLRRHLGMVFATARRLVSDAHEAEEIAQTVFQLFAEKAGTIEAGQPLAGWLYHTARHHALHRVRSEGRRRQREQLAAAMNPATESAPPPPLLAELEDALTELETDERDALVLRFLEDRQLREVGRELGVSEEAARKRVARALDRLRDVFARRGVTASTGAITVALIGQSTIGIPASLGAAITTTVLGGTAAATAVATTTAMTSMFNLKTAAALVAVATVTGTSTYVVKDLESSRLQNDLNELRNEHARLASGQQQSSELVQVREEQLERLRKEVAELPRLRGEVDKLNRELTDLAAVRTENESLRQEMNKLVAELVRNQGQAQSLDQELDMRKELEKEAGVRRLNELHMLGLALIMAADDNQGWFPDDAQLAKIVGNEDPKTDVKLQWNELQPANVEILFRGHIQDIAEPARTIVARQKDYTISSAGNRVNRVYGFADGHSEIHAANSLAELTTWEAERIIPPELQSRRPR